MNYFALNQSVSAAGPTASCDVSQLPSGADFTVTLQLTGLTSGKNVTVAMEESLDGFNADVRSFFQRSFVGPISVSAPVTQSWRRYQLPDNRFGTTGTQGAAIRLNILKLDAGATLTYTFYLQ